MGKKRKKKCVLVCNAHIDPVWLWEWKEGLAETLSTFRTAARLCSDFGEFVFNHNEALLYGWVEAYDPDLFSRIRDLVLRGKWHIMGGWVLQPDCNMPSGEALARQVLHGRRYFCSRFGRSPETAVNLDSFGHSRGLVQILRKSGYTSYLFCRPQHSYLDLPSDDFVWAGYDGSKVVAHRAREHYNSASGKVGERIRRWIAENGAREVGLLLWGIGNHGGGASFGDLQAIRETERALKSENAEWELLHGTPEDYFKILSGTRKRLPVYRGDLNPWAPGCYASMARIKRQYRRLENMYFLTEKSCTHAALSGGKYPHAALREALSDLLFCQFHDVLPGSSVEAVEAFALQRMAHGLDILDRLQAESLNVLLSGQKAAGEGEIVIFIYNPHPHASQWVADIELQPREPNFDENRPLSVRMTDADGNAVPCQVEKERSNLNQDFRKRVVFRAALEAAAVGRFVCTVKPEPGKKEPPPSLPPGPVWRFRSDTARFEIDARTGLLAQVGTAGARFLKKPLSFRIFKDSADSWAMTERGFREEEGVFTLMSSRGCARWCGLQGSLAPVRLIEQGPVRRVVEAFFEYGRSVLVLRYMIPSAGSEIGIEVRVFWNEAFRMLKMCIPTAFARGQCSGQVPYGTETVSRQAEEICFQKWVCVASEDGTHAMTVVNDGTYGLDFSGGELRLSMLRSPAYSAMRSPGNPDAVPRDRYEPRMDQGERHFRFWICCGEAGERKGTIDREAQLINESPLALVFSPSGKGAVPAPSVRLSSPSVRMTALKMSEEGERLILRLFESSGRPSKTAVDIPVLGMAFQARLGAFEIKTFSIDLESKAVSETDLAEGQDHFMKGRLKAGFFSRNAAARRRSL